MRVRGTGEEEAVTDATGAQWKRAGPITHSGKQARHHITYRYYMGSGTVPVMCDTRTTNGIKGLDGIEFVLFLKNIPRGRI